MAQHLDHHAGKAALWEHRRALDEHHHVVLVDFSLDALLYWIFHCFALLLGTVGVVIRAEKMEGDVGLVADHPAVVTRRDVEDVSRAYLGDGAVVRCSSCAARDDDADMLDRAARRAGRRTDMQRPSPAWFIGRAADRHAAYPNNLELSFLKGPNFVGLLEPLQHHIHVLSHRLMLTICLVPGYRVAKIIFSTSRSRSLPKKISSPTKKVGEPNVPRSTERSVLASNRALTSASWTSSPKRSALKPDSSKAARKTAGSSSFFGSDHMCR